MSVSTIIKLILDQNISEDAPELGFISFKHAPRKHSFREGVNVINVGVYDIYMVVKQSDEDDETDAEEEIPMTPMIINKPTDNSFKTVIPESDDDGEESDDSTDSIILSSQENKKESKTSATAKQMQESSEIRLHLTESSIHDLETQPHNLESKTQPQQSLIHDLETQPHEIEFHNVFKKINKEEEPPQLSKDQDIHDMETQQIVPGANTLFNIHQADTQEMFKVPHIPKSTMELNISEPSIIADLEVQQVSANVSKENDCSISDSEICDFDDFTEEFQVAESQSLLVDNVPELPASPKLPTIAEETHVSDKLVDHEDQSDIKDSDLCDFDGFTENFEEQLESQSLFTNVDNVPTLPTSPKLATPTEEAKLNVCMNSNKQDGENKLSHFEPDPDATLVDEPTQIIPQEAEVSIDIYEAATQMPPNIQVAVPHNESSPDIYSMPTQCIVKNDVLNTSGNIYEATTQCITKKEVESDSDTTDIEDDIIETWKQKKKIDSKPSKNSEDKDNDRDSDEDVNMTQVVELVPATNVDKFKLIKQPTNIVDFDAPTQVTAEPKANNDNFDAPTQVIMQPTDVDNFDAPTEVIKQSMDVVDFDAPTQVITEPKANVDIFDAPTEVIKQSSNVDDFDAPTQIIVQDTNINNMHDADDDIYNMATQVIEVGDERKENAGSSNINNRSSSGKLCNESFISPITKPVLLSTDSLAGETSIHSGKTNKQSETYLAEKRCSDLIDDDGKKFTFSTPNVGSIRKKIKSTHNTNINIGDTDVTMVLKKIAPSLEVSQVEDELSCYNTTQDVAAELMAQTPKTSKEIDSPGKENVLYKTPNYYNSTQEVINDLCTQPTNNKLNQNNENFYKCTQDVLNDLCTQVSPVKKSTTTPSKVLHSQLSESSEEMFKSPRKRKLLYTISDSELDSPQIEYFANNVMAKYQANVESDHEESVQEDTEDIPVVHRIPIPLKKSKIDSLKDNNEDSEINTDRVNATRKPTSKEKAKCSKDKDIPSNLKDKDIPSNSKDKDIPSNSKDKDIPSNSKDKDKPSNSKSKDKKAPNNQKKNTSAIPDHSSKEPTEDSVSINIENILQNDTASSNEDTGTRRSARTRKVNKKYEQTDKDTKISETKRASKDTNISETKRTSKDTNISETKRTSSRRKNNRSETMNQNVPTTSTPNVEVTDVKKSRIGNTMDNSNQKNENTKSQNETKRTSSRRKYDSKSENNKQNIPSTSIPSVVLTDVIKDVKTDVKKGVTRSLCESRDRSTSSCASAGDISRRTYKVMFTSLDALVPVLGNTINKLGGDVVDKDGEVLIAAVPCKRTVKVMIAAARGIPIVSQEWITASKRARGFVDPWDHILKCQALESRYNINLETVLRSAQPYLTGWLVYITPSMSMPMDQLKELVETCGGTVEIVSKTTSRRSLKCTKGNSGTLSVSCAQDSALWPLLPHPIVSMELLLQGCFTHLLSISNYTLKKA